MKRRTEQSFLYNNNGYTEGVMILHIENGEVYWVAEVEEYPECGLDNPEGLRIMVGKSPIKLDRSRLIEYGTVEISEEEEYENTSLVYYYETKEEYDQFCNISECLLSLASAKDGHDEIDIFELTSREMSDIIDVLKDGDYIFNIL